MRTNAMKYGCNRNMRRMRMRYNGKRVRNALKRNINASITKRVGIFKDLYKIQISA